jgi:hypothetical protein
MRNYNERKRIYDSISNVIYNTKVLPFEKNELNYCVICRVELDNSQENIVILPERDSIVHENVFYRKKEKD